MIAHDEDQGNHIPEDVTDVVGQRDREGGITVRKEVVSCDERDCSCQVRDREDNVDGLDPAGFIFEADRKVASHVDDQHN